MFRTQTDSADSFKRRFNKYFKTVHSQTIVVRTQLDMLKMFFQLFENFIQIFFAKMISPHMPVVGRFYNIFKMQIEFVRIYVGYIEQICDHTACCKTDKLWKRANMPYNIRHILSKQKFFRQPSFIDNREFLVISFFRLSYSTSKPTEFSDISIHNSFILLLLLFPIKAHLLVFFTYNIKKAMHRLWYIAKLFFNIQPSLKLVSIRFSSFFSSYI